MQELADQLAILLLMGAGAFVFGVLLEAVLSLLFGAGGDPATYGIVCVAALWGTILVRWAFDKG